MWHKSIIRPHSCIIQKMKIKIIGTLLPLSALNAPNRFSEGLVFLNWLKKTGQQAWQLLPLHETHLEKDSQTKHVSSPYKSYGIGLDPQYMRIHTKEKIDRKEYQEFKRKNNFWVFDYAFFCALRDFLRTDNWTMWPKEIRDREPGTLHHWSRKLSTDINRFIEQQFLLNKQFNTLRKSAKQKNILLIGDLSFYLPLESPLVWMNRELFRINSDGSYSVVSGIQRRPDSPYGRQVWGHPIYSWGTTSSNKGIIKLFDKRLRYLASLFDIVRLDSVNAFFRYSIIDIENERNDTVATGPGKKVFNRILSAAQKYNLSVFAEDAGAELSTLRNILKQENIPGIKIFRYSFNNILGIFIDYYLNLKNYPVNSFAYTTTHDTETLIAWLTILTREQKQYIARKLHIQFSVNDRTFARILRQKIIDSPSRIVIIPMQDWLLTTDRINIPGTEKEINDTNWQYKLDIPIEDLPLVNVSEELIE